MSDLLRQARNAQLTTEDLTLLNSKVIPNVLEFDLHSTVSVVRLNSFRHTLKIGCV
jgi:hypothetical protein